MKNAKNESCGKRVYCTNPYCTGEDTGDCFKAPHTCEECVVNTHCRNRGLNGVRFELPHPGTFTPACFGKFHSTR